MGPACPCLTSSLLSPFLDLSSRSPLCSSPPSGAGRRPAWARGAAAAAGVPTADEAGPVPARQRQPMRRRGMRRGRGAREEAVLDAAWRHNGGRRRRRLSRRWREGAEVEEGGADAAGGCRSRPRRDAGPGEDEDDGFGGGRGGGRRGCGGGARAAGLARAEATPSRAGSAERVGALLGGDGVMVAKGGGD